MVSVVFQAHGVTSFPIEGIDKQRSVNAALGTFPAGAVILVEAELMAVLTGPSHCCVCYYAPDSPAASFFGY